MGLEKVDFVWYFKNITSAALLGYLGGIGVYIAQHNLLENFVSNTINVLPAISSLHM